MVAREEKAKTVAPEKLRRTEAITRILVDDASGGDANNQRRMKIFISHSSYDLWVASQMSRLLIDDGHTTFLDAKDLKTGDSLDAKIHSHLADSDHLLIVLSPASLKSQWVFVEIGGAKALNKTIIPMMLHVAVNEVPSMISQYVARDINDFHHYLMELKTKPPGHMPKLAPVEVPPKKFQIGQAVRISEVQHLTEQDKALPPKWMPEMDKYSGVTTTITGIANDDCVYLEADSGLFLWSPRWLS